MKSKKEIFIAELEADRFNAIQNFDRIQIKRKIKRYARLVYAILIVGFFVLCYLSTFVSKGTINLFSGI